MTKLRMTHLLSFFCFLLISRVSWGQFTSSNGYDPSADLQQAFGGRCKSFGFFNRQAMADTKALEQILTQVKNDTACSGLYGALQDVYNLNIPRLMVDRAAREDYEFLLENSMNMKLALQQEEAKPGSEQNIELITSLRASLAETNIQLIKTKNAESHERMKKRLESYENFNKYSKQAFAQLNNSQACFVNKAGLKAQVAAQLVGLGAPLASGVLGSLILNSASFVENMLSYIQKNGVSKQIKELVNPRLVESLGCSFEALSSTYCQARDSQILIDLQKTHQPPALPWMEGKEIMAKDLPSFEEWINSLNAGSPASTLGEASDRETGMGIEHKYKIIKNQMEPIMTTALKNLGSDRVNTAEITRKALNDLASKLAAQPCVSIGGNTCTESPFAGFFAADATCGPYIYLYSGGQSRVRDPGGDAFQDCGNYIASKFKDEDLPDLSTTVQKAMAEMFTKVSESVNQQKAQVIGQDHDLIIAQADNRSKNQRTARDFMNSTISYLDSLLSDPESIARNPNQKSLILKLKEQLVKGLVVLDTNEETVPAPEPRAKLALTSNPKGNNGRKRKAQAVVNEAPVMITRKIESQEKVAQLSALLIPGTDIFAVSKSLKLIVEQDRDDRIEKGQLDPHLSEMMQASADEVLSDLIAQSVGLEAARSQVRNARETSKRNLDSFPVVFQDNIKTHLEMLSKEPGKDAQESLSLLCMQSLSIPKSPMIGKLDLSKYCKGRKYKSVYNDSKTDSKIEMDWDELSKKPFEARTCSVYDFYRKSYLYGLKTHRNSPPTPSPANTR